MQDASTTDLPPNARLDALTFDESLAQARFSLHGGDARDVCGADVTALFGARLKYDAVTTTMTGGGISASKIAVTAATGLPVGVSNKPKETTVEGEVLRHALALRASGVDEILYLTADSFNFRKALGPEATYATELNLRLFVVRLAAFAPSAAQDDYFKAMLAKSPLPPPLSGLREFLRQTAR